MTWVRRTTVSTGLIVVLLLTDTALSGYPPPHAQISGYQPARRGSSPGHCVSMPANMTLCRGVRYSRVRLPNLFGHETLQEAAEQADSWVLLVNIHCQPDTQVFYQYLHILSEQFLNGTSARIRLIECCVRRVNSEETGTVASLGWVTPGAATESVTPIFSKTWRPFFAHRCHYHYRFLLLSVGCHPLEGVTPHIFYLSDLVSPLFFVNLLTIFFLRVSPRPRLVTSLNTRDVKSRLFSDSTLWLTID